MTGCGSVGNPTAIDILKTNRDADIIKLDGLIYSRLSNPKDGYAKEEKIGEIKKKTTNTFWFRNLYSSKLPKGTEVYSTEEDYESGDAPYVILIELNGELIEYQAIIEG